MNYLKLAEKYGVLSDYTRFLEYEKDGKGDGWRIGIERAIDCLEMEENPSNENISSTFKLFDTCLPASTLY